MNDLPKLPIIIDVLTLKGSATTPLMTLERIVEVREQNGMFSPEARHILNHYHEMTFGQILERIEAVTNGDITFKNR